MLILRCFHAISAFYVWLSPCWCSSAPSLQVVANPQTEDAYGELTELASPNQMQPLTLQDPRFRQLLIPPRKGDKLKDNPLNELLLKIDNCSEVPAGSLRKLCHTTKELSGDDQGMSVFRAFANWPMPCPIFMHGTSMGADLRQYGARLNSSTLSEPHVLRLPPELAKAAFDDGAQLLAISYVEEMRFVRNSSGSTAALAQLQTTNRSALAELLLSLRALECDSRFDAAYVNVALPGCDWGVTFAHSFITDLMLGSALLPWTKLLVKRNSTLKMAFMGSNSGNEAFYASAWLGVSVVGYEQRCDLVRLSQSIAAQFLPAADIDFRCMDATDSDLSNIWVVYLDNEAWPFNATTRMFAHMAESLSLGAAVVSWPKPKYAHCRLDDHLQKLGWSAVGNVRILSSWNLSPNPSVKVWVKTSEVHHHIAEHTSLECDDNFMNEDDDDDVSDEELDWLMENLGDDISFVQDVLKALNAQQGVNNVGEDDDEEPINALPAPEKKYEL